jgi:UDP-N-acetyl-D-glucosamine dehydrogenase
MLKDTNVAQRTSAVTAPQRRPFGNSVGILGLGIVGTASAHLAARAGYRVVGYDLNPARVEEVRFALNKQACEISCEPHVLSSADIIVLAVRAATGPDGITNEHALASAWQTVTNLPPRERLILIETTVAPGTTRRLATTGPHPHGALLHVAHCPERLRVGEALEDLRTVPRLVGGLTPTATRLGCEFIESLGIPAVPVSQPEVAELSKLLENAFLTTGIALMGEISRIAHALGIRASEVAEAAETKPHGYFPFRPGPAIGGHCLINDMRLLRSAASALGVDSELLRGVQHAADRLNDNVMARLRVLLAAYEVSLRGACVWLIGIGFKVGSNDPSESAAIGLVRLLRQHGCSVVFSDSQIPASVVDGAAVPPAELMSSTFRADAALLLSGDSAIDLAEVATRCRVVLDLGGSRIMRGDACNLERL